MGQASMSKFNLFCCLLLTIYFFNSCCLGDAKCNVSEFGSSVSILDKLTNKNLLFGPDRLYDNTKISFFSLVNQDTVYHASFPGSISGTVNDSTLSVFFDNRKFNRVFVKLNDTDVDTLNMSYEMINAGPCCDDYYRINPLSYNGNNISTPYQGYRNFIFYK